MAVKPPVCDFGWKATNFILPSTEGEKVSLDDVAGKNGCLIMFICNHCPYVVSVLDRIVAESSALQEIDIGVAAICSNDSNSYPEDSFENMVTFAQRAEFTFPYLHDEDQKVAQSYGAACTPDFFGFNSNLELQYRGRLDDAGRSSANSNTKRELFEAMKMVAETGNGPVSQTPSMGCSIKWSY